MIDVALGFAADERGTGIAYAQLAAKGRKRLLRVPFAVRRYPALLEREVAYAATTAIATQLSELGCKRVNLHIPDERLVSDVRGRAELPLPLAMEYVRLGCALNRFAQFELQPGNDQSEDLAARARAEVALNIAA